MLHFVDISAVLRYLSGLTLSCDGMWVWVWECLDVLDVSWNGSVSVLMWLYRKREGDEGRGGGRGKGGSSIRSTYIDTTIPIIIDPCCGCEEFSLNFSGFLLR